MKQADLSSSFLLFCFACFIPHPSSFLLFLRVILDPDDIFGGDALSRFFVTGGAGFIGGHLVARLLHKSDTQVVVYDNFISGRSWHFQSPKEDEKRLDVISGAIKDLSRLREARAGSAARFHRAS